MSDEGPSHPGCRAAVVMAAVAALVVALAAVATFAGR